MLKSFLPKKEPGNLDGELLIKPFSVGQALRDIHSQENLITCEDILLIFGDVLANFDLSKVIAEYTKKKRDRSIMTKIFKRVPLNSPLRTQEDDCVVILDNNTSQVLQYKHIPDSKEIDFNLGNLEKRILFVLTNPFREDKLQ